MKSEYTSVGTISGSILESSYEDKSKVTREIDNIEPSVIDAIITIMIDFFLDDLVSLVKFFPMINFKQNKKYVFMKF